MFEQLETGEHQRAKLLFLQLAFFIGFRDDGRSQVVVDGVVTLKHIANLLQESRVGMQARNFVLIFVSHQLEEVACDCFTQTRFVKRRFCSFHAQDNIAVTLGI